MRLTILFLFLLASPKTQAAVNTLTGGFTDHWFDFPIQKKLFFHRTYNSRTLHEGWFGLGWCSILETRITQVANDMAKIKTCNSPEITLYRLTQNPKLYQGGNWSMARLKKRFVLRNGHGDLLRFDRRGRLIRMDSEHFPAITLKYKRRKIILRSEGGVKFSLHFANGRLQSVSLKKRRIVEYSYERGLLTQVRNAWNNTYSYTYDDSQNLSSIRFPDQTYKSISYDEKLDRVRTVLHRNLCYESYEYRQTPPPYANGYKVRARKKCPQGDERIVDLNYVYVNRALAYFEKSENGEVISRRYYRQPL